MTPPPGGSPPPRSLPQWIGRRGAALLTFAAIDLLIGWSLIDHRTQPAGIQAYRAARAVAPFGLWGAIWIGVGILCLAQAFTRPDRVAFSAAVSVKVVWAGSFLVSWVFLGVSRAWLNGATWGLIAALVFIISGWPEPHRPPAQPEPPRADL